MKIIQLGDSANGLERVRMHEPEPDEKPVLEAAAEVGLHPVTVARWARTGRLEARWVKGRRLVSVVRLRALLAEPPRRAGALREAAGHERAGGPVSNLPPVR